MTHTIRLPYHDRYPYSPITERKDYSWPEGKRLAVYLGLNIEHFAFGAGDGAQMQALLDESMVDLVILDLRLPGEDGLTLARRLREQSAVPIIILTGRNDPADRVMGLELAADDYVTKPFELRELLARVRAVLPPGHAKEQAPVLVASLIGALQLARVLGVNAQGRAVLAATRKSLLETYAG